MSVCSTPIANALPSFPVDDKQARHLEAAVLLNNAASYLLHQSCQVTSDSTTGGGGVGQGVVIVGPGMGPVVETLRDAVKIIVGTIRTSAPDVVGAAADAATTTTTTTTTSPHQQVQVQEDEGKGQVQEEEEEEEEEEGKEPLALTPSRSRSRSRSHPNPKRARRIVEDYDEIAHAALRRAEVRLHEYFFKGSPPPSSGGRRAEGERMNTFDQAAHVWSRVSAFSSDNSNIHSNSNSSFSISASSYLPAPRFVEAGGGGGPLPLPMPLLVRAAPFALPSSSIFPSDFPPPRVSPPSSSSSPWPPRPAIVDADEASAAILCNMALAYHLGAAASRGVDDGDINGDGARGFHLNKAVGLYEMCASVLWPCPAAPDGPRVPANFNLNAATTPAATAMSVDLREDDANASSPVFAKVAGLREALLNNLGQIRIEQGDHDEGMRRFRALEGHIRGAGSATAIAGAGRSDDDEEEGMCPFEYNLRCLEQDYGDY